MVARAFFVARWVIVVAWAVGVSPILGLTWLSMTDAFLEISLLLRTLGGVCGMLLSFCMLALAWRVAAFPLITVTGTEITIANPVWRRKTAVIPRVAIHTTDRANRLGIRLHRDGGPLADIDLRLFATGDRERLLSLIGDGREAVVGAPELDHGGVIKRWPRWHPRSIIES